MEIEYKVIGKDACPYCVKAKNLLSALDESYSYYDISDVPGELKEPLKNVRDAGHTTVPQIFQVKDGEMTHIGGYQELSETIL